MNLGKLTLNVVRLISFIFYTQENGESYSLLFLLL